ncbi:MAG: branched-chain amino acid ABC transporter permease [Nitrospirae bacterium]|nr:branched-chain amino acid ABC transporter permease [Nitrospirota bacterium]
MNIFIIAAWVSLLMLPFTGLKTALLAFAGLIVSVLLFRFIRPLLMKIKTLRLKIPAINRGLLATFLVLILLFLPFISSDYMLDVFVLAGIYIILAIGLNVVVGFAGLLNLGFVAFYATGAYSFALLSTNFFLPFWACLIFSTAFSTLIGILLAIPALRLRGDYLAIVTLGFGEIVRLTLNNWDSLTNGPNGIAGIPAPSILGLTVTELSHYYYLIVLFACLSVLVVRRVHNSRVGRAWLAIREDEVAAGAMGIDTPRYRLIAFAFGAFWAGIAGTLFAGKMHFISPESFTFMESVLILCMVILGGLGSIPGVILGALILVVLPEALRGLQLYRMLALGAGLVLMMVFRPQGILGGIRASFRS